RSSRGRPDGQQPRRAPQGARRSRRGEGPLPPGTGDLRASARPGPSPHRHLLGESLSAPGAAWGRPGDARGGRGRFWNGCVGLSPWLWSSMRRGGFAADLRSIDPTNRSPKETTAVAAIFTRTIRSLEADGSRSRVVDLLLLAAVGAWAAWLISGRVALYEVSESARLEVEGAAHPIAAPLAGRVVETRMAIDREVREGEVLIALDDRAQRNALREKRARARALAERLEALRLEILAEGEVLAAHRRERAA